MTRDGTKTYLALSMRRCCLLAVLAASAAWHPAEAQTRQHRIPSENLSALADRLVEMTVDKDLSASCRVHLIEIENLSGPLLTEESVLALETTLKDALGEQFPESGCEAGFLEGYDAAEKGDIAIRLADEGRPGFLYTLSFFPRGDGLLLLATAYRPDGRFAAFSNKVVVETVKLDGDRPLIAADEPATTTDAETPEAVVETATPSAPPAPSEDVDGLEAIGTPAEIAAIRAQKFASMPDDPEPASPPAIGLRIDIGGAVEPTVIEDLARAFLTEQSESASHETITDDDGRIVIKTPTESELNGIEIVDNDRSDAFDKLFRGDVDLVVSSEPISQTDYDRFADAFGVDMRSGSGETVIGIDATGLIVHASNELPSLTKEVAAGIFSGDVADWGQGVVADSGLAGPIQALAPAYQVGFQDGYDVRPDMTLETSAEIANLVEVNPLSIGIGNATMDAEEDYRTLAIEECGIVYAADDFFLRTEDHPLVRRLFLYSNPAKGNRFRNAFLFFATSDAGQDLIGRHAVDLGVALGGPERTRERIEIIEGQDSTTPELKDELIDTIEGARRLSTTFRFRFDSPELRLDQHAARDLANLIRLSKRENIDPRRLMLLGFADADGEAAYNETLSRERAEAIAKRLRTYGIDVEASNILGFGEEAPVACNTRPDGTEDDVGKARNRRVEIWLRESGA